MIKIILLILALSGEPLEVDYHETIEKAIEIKEVLELTELEPKGLKKKTPEPPSKEPQGLSQEELLLARLVRAEAQGEPFEGKVAVARVVLNRVESDKFPDTIEEVIYQSGQFQPVSNGSINKPATKEAKEAVKQAKNTSSNDSLYFYNPDIATSDWLDSRPTTKVIGNHVFKK